MEKQHEIFLTKKGILPRFPLYNNINYIVQTEELTNKELNKIKKNILIKENKILCTNCGRKINIQIKINNINKYKNIIKNKLPNKYLFKNIETTIIFYILYYKWRIPNYIIKLILNIYTSFEITDKYNMVMRQLNLEYINLFYSNKIKKKYLFFIKRVLHIDEYIYPKWYDKYRPADRDIFCHNFILEQFFDKGLYSMNLNIYSKFCEYLLNYLYKEYPNILGEIFNNDNKKIIFFKMFRIRSFACLYLSIIYKYEEILELGKPNMLFELCYNNIYIKNIRNKKLGLLGLSKFIKYSINNVNN